MFVVWVLLWILCVWFCVFIQWTRFNLVANLTWRIDSFSAFYVKTLNRQLQCTENRIVKWTTNKKNNVRLDLWTYNYVMQPNKTNINISINTIFFYLWKPCVCLPLSLCVELTLCVCIYVHEEPFSSKTISMLLHAHQTKNINIAHERTFAQSETM